MGRTIYYGALCRSQNCEFMSELLNKIENNGKQSLRTCLHTEESTRFETAGCVLKKHAVVQTKSWIFQTRWPQWFLGIVVLRWTQQVECETGNSWHSKKALRNVYLSSGKNLFRVWECDTIPKYPYTITKSQCVPSRQILGSRTKPLVSNFVDYAIVTPHRKKKVSIPWSRAACREVTALWFGVKIALWFFSFAVRNRCWL